MRKFLLAAALTGAMTLTACGGDDAGTGARLSGDPLPKVAAPAGQQWSDVVTETAEGGIMMGNPDAPIRMVEFGSMSCSHCAEFSETAFEPIRDDYVESGRVSFEFRNYVRDPYDLTATLLARCAGKERFFALTEATFQFQPQMFENLQATPPQQMQAIQALPPAQQLPALAQASGLLDFATGRGVARDQAQACLSNTETVEALAEATRQANEKYDIPGTPTILINGQVVPDTSWRALENQLQQMGARDGAK